MASVEFYQFPYMSDNYGVLLHDTQESVTACIDCGDADAVLAALTHKNWKLDQILITHHHADHTEGLEALKSTTGAIAIGPAESASKLPGVDKHVADGDDFAFGKQRIQVMQTPGHTLDMLNYYLPEAGVLFTGDTLFAMGCGRLFEGDAATMHNSLNKISQLPADTVLYCSHEYTLTNGSFAETVDSENPALIERMLKVRELRDADQPTIPTKSISTLCRQRNS